MHVTCGAAHDPCPLSSDRVQQYIIREKGGQPRVSISIQTFNNLSTRISLIDGKVGLEN
jgi:hypothetical protein